jgi:hypothetical protein
VETPLRHSPRPGICHNRRLDDTAKFAWKSTSGKTPPRGGETVERGKQGLLALLELYRVIDRGDSAFAHMSSVSPPGVNLLRCEARRPDRRRELSAMESRLTARQPLPRRPRRSTALCAPAYGQRSGSSIISPAIRPAARSQPGFRRQRHRRCRTGNPWRPVGEGASAIPRNHGEDILRNQE